MRRLIAAFNAGEISPLLDARADTEKYGNACRIMENIVPKIYGGAFGRQGMEYMGSTKLAGKQASLIPFTFSVSTNFVIECGHLYMRFWSNGQQVMSGGLPLEIVTPFTEDDIFNIQYAQANDVMYLVDGVHSVQKLTRIADDNWTIAPVAWTFPALQDENITTLTLACSHTSGTGRSLTASSALFNAGHVGAYFQLAHRRDGAFVELALTSSSTSGELRVLGKYDIFTYGDWTGKLELQTKDALGGWETIRSFTSKDDRNVQTTGTADEERIFRWKYTHTTAGSTPPRALLEAADSRIYGVVKVTAFISSTLVTVDVVKELYATSAVMSWSEGAWSDYRGQPRTVTIHEQRLAFGGNAHQPLTIWGSVTGDFENFKRSTLDDAAYTFLIGSTRGNSIVWITSQTGLMVGTQGEEWVVGASGQDQAITATSVQVKRQSNYGSAYIQAVQGSDAVIFVQRGRRKVREFVYQFERNAFTAPDLTLLAEHVTAGGIKQMAFASNPDPVIWAVTQTGGLLSMTFERDQSVVGWSRHITDGEVEAVAVVYGGVGMADEVWFTAKRTIKDSSTHEDKIVRYVERLDPKKWKKLDESDLSRFIYLDCAKLIEQEASVTVTGLGHLEGKTVGILADGSNHPARTVTGGQISLQVPAEIVVVGLPFTPRIQPTKTEIQMGDGTAQGRKWKNNKAGIRLWRTTGCEYASASEERFYPVPVRNVATETGEPEPPFTGDIDVTLQSVHRSGVDITLRQTLPLPFHVLAITPVFGITGD